MPHRSALISAILLEVAGIARDLAAARSGPFGPLRLSRSQLDALFVLAHSPADVSAGALAAALSVTPGAVTQLVTGLRNQGLVETAADADDARVRVIRLTPRARAQVDEFETDAAARLAPRFAGLGDADLERLAALLTAARRTP